MFTYSLLHSNLEHFPFLTYSPYHSNLEKFPPFLYSILIETLLRNITPTLKSFQCLRIHFIIPTLKSFQCLRIHFSLKHSTSLNLKMVPMFTYSLLHSDLQSFHCLHTDCFNATGTFPTSKCFHVLCSAIPLLIYVSLVRDHLNYIKHSLLLQPGPIVDMAVF